MYSSSKVNNSIKNSASDSESSVTEEKITELINDHLNWKGVVGEKRKIYNDKYLKKNSNEYEVFHHQISFASLLVRKDLLNEYQLRNYDQKVKILDIWWNEKRKRSLNKRTEYFKKESVFYNQIYDILNLKGEKISYTTKQLRLEKWIIDYENYRIRDLIEKGEMDRSSESKIYSNIFRSLNKEWTNRMSKFTINKHRELKKIYSRSIEKNNINCNNQFLIVFIFNTMGPLNTFSLLYNKNFRTCL